MSAADPLILLNPQAAGGRNARVQWQAQAQLDVLGVTAPLHVTPSASHAQDLIVHAPAGSRVVLFGGDGSLWPLLPALVAGQHPLGLVPTGTGNDLARALGLRGATLPVALTRALQTPATPLDLGRVQFDGQDTWFASSLTVGFDAKVARRAQAGARSWPGQVRYLIATLQELVALDTWPVRASVDGVAQPLASLHLCSVLNTPSYGSGMPVTPNARTDDGLLDGVQLRALPRAKLLWALQQMLRGAHLNNPAVVLTRGRDFVIESNQPLPLAADGDVLGSAQHIAVTCVPNALQVVRGTA